MATLVVPLTNSSVKQFGQMGDGTIGSLTGQRQWIGRDSGFTFKFTGTGLTVKLVGITTIPTMEVSIDGGAYSDVTHTGASGVQSDDVLATGLSDTLHTVTFRHKSGTQANMAIDTAAAFTVTGAAPAVSDPDNWGTLYDAADIRLLAYSRLPNAFRSDATSGGYSNLLSLTNPDSCIRFRSDATQIRFLANLNAAKWRLFRDGTPVAATSTLGGTSRVDWVTACIGQDGAVHEWELVNAGAAYVALQIQHIMLIGGTLNTLPADRYKLLVIGDSQVAGFGTSDSTTTWGSMLAKATNRDVVNVGLSSSRVCTYQNFATLSAGQRIGDFTRPAYTNVDEIIALYSHNDGVNQTALADYNREYLRMINRLVASYPSANIRCLAMLPTTASITPLTRAQYIAEVANVVSTIGLSRVTHITMETTDFPVTYNATTGQDTTDGIHPNASGNTKIYNRLLPFLSTAPNITTASGGISASRSFGGM